MDLHVLQHVSFEGPGVIRDWARARGHRLRIVRLHRGDSLPRPSVVAGLVIMGGPMSVNDEADLSWLKPEKRLAGAVMRRGRPVLGLCLGAQLMASALGARVYRHAVREIGWFRVRKEALAPDAATAPVARAFPRQAAAFHWHGETFDLPRGATHLARSAGCRHQAFLWGDRALGLQFHFEVTRAGAESLVRRCAGEMTPGRFVQSPERILSDDARFVRANRLMYRLLDALFEGGPSGRAPSSGPTGETPEDTGEPTGKQSPRRRHEHT